MPLRHPALRPVRLAAALAVAAGCALTAVAGAAVTVYTASLSGPNESPPNASPGIGNAQVDIDPVAHTMRVQASFTGLVGTTTNCHIHGPTTVAGTGTAGVATRTPTFLGFPSGVTSGVYDHTYDMTDAGSYNPSFVTANGGTTASAETALFQAIANGKAYFNVHSTVFPGGEIRGFLQLSNPTPTARKSWGRIKSLYR